MEPQENKQLALRKAISAHEEAEASLADLTNDRSEAKYATLLQRVRANLSELRADAEGRDPAETV